MIETGYERGERVGELDESLAGLFEGFDLVWVERGHFVRVRKEGAAWRGVVVILRVDLIGDGDRRQTMKQVGIELPDWNGGDVRGEGWCLRCRAIRCVYSIYVSTLEPWMFRFLA